VILRSHTHSHLAVPDLDDPDRSLSLTAPHESQQVLNPLHQSLTCCPGSLVVSDRFFGLWPPGVAGCECINILSLVNCQMYKY